ncbi:helix-turn-helix domain-containing protein [Micromonospora sp. NPDC048935]|uniref:helix-turn-helix domain-containing protein n=1 Tax=Micromonospora sp. NPDC048935 TaxID=3364262 RepID=UPI0037151D6F
MPISDSELQRLASLIKAGRAARGWQQEKLADETGVGARTIKRYEGAQQPRPDREHLIAIFRVLDLDRRELAAILGILSRDELELPPEPARILSARTRELLELLEDPDLPDEERDAYAEMLRARLRGRRQRGSGSSDAPRRDARGIG